MDRGEVHESKGWSPMSEKEREREIDGKRERERERQRKRQGENSREKDHYCPSAEVMKGSVCVCVDSHTVSLLFSVSHCLCPLLLQDVFTPAVRSHFTV